MGGQLAKLLENGNGDGNRGSGQNNTDEHILQQVVGSGGIIKEECQQSAAQQRS